MTRSLALLLTAVVCTTSLASRSVRAGEPSVLIKGASIVDVEHGRLVGPRDIAIADGFIVAIDKAATSTRALQAGARIVDGHGRFVMPGLVDMHVHLFNNWSGRPPNTWSFPLYVANGVTGVREMAALPEAIAIVNQWRAAAADGTLIAPRIVAAGVAVDGETPAQAAERVGISADAGADFIKVFSEVSAADWHAIIDAAQRRSLPVFGHVPAGVALLDAANGGQRSDEHLMQAFEACTTLEQNLLDTRRELAEDALIALRDQQEARVLAAYDQKTCDRVAAKLARTPQVQVPTLQLVYVESKPLPPFESDPRWHYLRPDERARWIKIEQGLTLEDRAVGPQRWPVARKIATTFHRAGVVMLAGTDSPMPGLYPGFALHDELERLVDAGVTPAQALRAATLDPARFLGRADKEGSVAVGKRADLVVLDADPLRDIRNTRRIESVLLDGRVLDRRALDALLSDAAKANDAAAAAAPAKSS